MHTGGPAPALAKQRSVCTALVKTKRKQWALMPSTKRLGEARDRQMRWSQMQLVYAYVWVAGRFLWALFHSCCTGCKCSINRSCACLDGCSFQLASSLGAPHRHAQLLRSLFLLEHLRSCQLAGSGRLHHSVPLTGMRSSGARARHSSEAAVAWLVPSPPTRMTPAGSKGRQGRCRAGGRSGRQPGRGGVGQTGRQRRSQRENG